MSDARREGRLASIRRVGVTVGRPRVAGERAGPRHAGRAGIRHGGAKRSACSTVRRRGHQRRAPPAAVRRGRPRTDRRARPAVAHLPGPALLAASPAVRGVAAGVGTLPAALDLSRGAPRYVRSAIAPRVHPRVHPRVAARSAVDPYVSVCSIDGCHFGVRGVGPRLPRSEAYRRKASHGEHCEQPHRPRPVRSRHRPMVHPTRTPLAILFAALADPAAKLSLVAVATPPPPLRHPDPPPPRHETAVIVAVVLWHRFRFSPGYDSHPLRSVRQVADPRSRRLARAGRGRTRDCERVPACRSQLDTRPTAPARSSSPRLARSHGVGALALGVLSPNAEARTGARLHPQAPRLVRPRVHRGPREEPDTAPDAASAVDRVVGPSARGDACADPRRDARLALGLLRRGHRRPRSHRRREGAPMREGDIAPAADGGGADVSPGDPRGHGAPARCARASDGHEAPRALAFAGA